MPNLKQPGNTALARPGGRIEPWKSADWQQLWLASQARERPWRTLALVPAGPGATPEQMVQVAMTLAHTGMMHLGMPVHVADATRITLAQLVQFSEEMTHYAQQAGTVLMALSALSDNVTSMSLARTADCALLCVFLQNMVTKEAKKTVEKIGAKHFIGAATFRVI